jgi:hypothetical protein
MELKNETKWKINCLNRRRLSKLNDWLLKRYWGKKETPISRYITTRYYHWEEYRAGLL